MKFRLKIRLICNYSSQNLKTTGVLPINKLNFGTYELLNKFEWELIRRLNELLLFVLFSQYILLLLKLFEGHLALLPEIFHVF